MAYGSTIQKAAYYYSPSLVKNFISSIYGWGQYRKRYGEFFEKYFQSLIANQWNSREEIEKIQFNKTKTFLINAEAHSKYYRELFERYNFSPQKLESLSELSVLPILDKQTLRKNLEGIINDNSQQYKVHWNHTGGTTGAALEFPETLESFQREYAYRYVQYLWGNVKRGEKFAFCVGHPVAYQERRKPPFWVYDYTNNWLCMSSFHLNEKNIKHYIMELEKFQPAMIHGYPSSLYLLAMANKHLGKRVNPKAAFTSSETLHNFQRREIEKSFGCKVFDYYGNGERCGFIAQCERGRYHLQLQHSYVEVLPDENNSDCVKGEGRLVCTGFGNYATPLIRYDIGDIAVLSEEPTCDCKRSGPIVKQIVGRTNDYVITPDGRFIGRLTPLFHNAFNVKEAQIIQYDINEIIIKIVPEPAFGKKDKEDILNKARQKMGNEIKIQFDYVDKIPRTKNAKYRFIVSNIPKKKLFEQLIQ